MANIPTSPHSDLQSANPDVAAGAERLFARYDRRLQRYLAKTVNTSAANLEDARAHAWLKLLETQPRGDTIFAWLRTVAEREAWRLDRLDRRTDAMSAASSQPAPASAMREYADMLAGLQTIHPRRRQLLLDYAAGHTTRELAARHGISEPRVLALISRARQQLAQRTGRTE